MFQTMLIFSPFIVLLIVGLVCLALGLRNYRIQKAKLTKELGERTFLFLGFGNSGLGAFCALLLLSTRSHTILLVSFLCTMTLFLIGEFVLFRLIIARKEYFFTSSITMLTAFLSWILFPMLINIHEPFTLIYSFFTVFLIFVQVILISNWQRMRVPDDILSTPEKNLEKGFDKNDFISKNEI